MFLMIYLLKIVVLQFAMLNNQRAIPIKTSMAIENLIVPLIIASIISSWPITNYILPSGYLT